MGNRAILWATARFCGQLTAQKWSDQLGKGGTYTNRTGGEVPSILRALRGVTTLDEVKTAFQTDHVRVRADVNVAPDAYNRILEIDGEFRDRADGKYAGKFGRRIELVNRRFRIYHGIIELEEEYQDDGIAWEHYCRAIRYYFSVLHAEMVYMDADFDGPYAWGDFGFEFTGEDWEVMLNRLEAIYRHRYGEPPSYYPETATELKHTEGPDGFEAGKEAIASIHEARGSLRMTLDFNDNRTIQFLRDEGILVS